MTTGQDLVDEVRVSLEDYGATITDNFNGDGTTKIWRTSSKPVKTGTLVVTIGGSATTAWTLNADNGEVTFNTAPPGAASVIMQYTKVVWREERILTAINAGIREMKGKVYNKGDIFVALQQNKSEYDLTSSTDVPASISGFTFPTDYVVATARAAIVKAGARIHQAFVLRSLDSIFVPFEYFSRPGSSHNLHLDALPVNSEVLKLVYSAPLTTPVAVGTTVDVPEEFIHLPVWYALGMVMEKKESPRVRFDQLPTMQNANASPVGSQRQTGTDYLRLFRESLQQNQMPPLPTRTRRQVRPWQFVG
jgi:hypothetical protein